MGLRGGRNILLTTPYEVRDAVCEALIEVGLLENTDGACDAYVRITTPRDADTWDDPVAPPTGARAPIIVDVYHEYRAEGGPPPVDPYLDAAAKAQWDQAEALLEGNGWDIEWDSRNAAVSYFAYNGPEGTVERYMKEAMERARARKRAG